MMTATLAFLLILSMKTLTETDVECTRRRNWPCRRSVGQTIIATALYKVHAEDVAHMEQSGDLEQWMWISDADHS